MKRVVTFRLDEGELAGWRAAAEAEGRTVSNWIVVQCRGVLGTGGELGSQKISKPGVEVEQRSVARRTGTIRAIEDLTHAVARKHIPVEEPKSGLPTCRHGKEQGANCWQCAGIAQVEAPKKAKGRGKK